MLAYEDLGEGTPLVLIHGLGQRKEAWVPQHPLASEYRLITPDLRGHGETTLETDITMENFAKDIIELLDSLEVEAAYFCGLSLGGIVAQEIYRQAPDRVLGLILSNTTSYIPAFFVSSTLLYAANHYRDPDFVDRVVDRGLHDKTYRSLAKQTFLIRDCYMDAAQAPVEENYFPLLIGINVPVLLIGGAEDEVTPVLNIHSMYMFTPGAKKVIFKDCGHLSNIEKSSQFNYQVNKFIKDLQEM